MIPKRSFASREQLDEFRDVLARSIGRTPTHVPPPDRRRGLEVITDSVKAGESPDGPRANASDRVG